MTRRRKVTRTARRGKTSARDRAESRKILIIVVAATVGIMLLMYFIMAG